MKKNVHALLLLLADIALINISFLFAYFLINKGDINPGIILEFAKISIITTSLKILIYQKFALYNSIWEYASIEELIKVVSAVTIGNTISICYMVFTSFALYPGVYIVAFTFEVVAVGGIRFSYRMLRRIKQHKSLVRQDGGKNILIIGSGSTASLIATQMKYHPETYGHVIGYIDDDNHKIGETIAGIKVLGNRYDIFSICKRYDVNEIIVAIPTATNEDKKEILDECKRTESKVRIVPGIMEILDGKVSLNKIRDVDIEDLLGREPVNLNMLEIATYIEGKTVLVTGGGGSIGSELCRQVARFNPSRLIILDIYENNIYEIQNELLREYEEKLSLEVLIASVRDKGRIDSIVSEYRPHVIFHAAAHKHVPLMEDSPQEAIKNNVFGTLNVAEAAKIYGVERFVLISTDKAVNPTNVMGASKRICELIVQALARESSTKFVAVRFGNVLGSNGSVIPLFKEQIKNGGPVTVTHKEIIRYFMTIQEAAQLVLQAAAIAIGGEVFVLDMGEPVKIYDLAVDLIRLSGLVPNEDIKIEITGLRHGEKLYEELLMAEEGLKDTKYKKIYIGSPSKIDFKILKRSLDMLSNELGDMTDRELREAIKVLVPNYSTAEEMFKKENQKNIKLERL